MKRTAHYVKSSKKKTGRRKMYAVRNADGKFKDVQQYEKAHRQDVKRKSKGE